MDIASFREFWALVQTVWREGLYGIPVGEMLAALAILGGSLWLRDVFTRLVIRSLRRATERTRTDLDNRLLDALHDPIRFVPIVMGVFFATSVLQVGGLADAFFDNLNRSLVVFTLFWGLYSATGPAGHLLRLAQSFFTEAMVEWLIKAGRVVFVLLGAAAVLEIWGIAVAPIIAGLGLFGVAVALGAQDLFKNLIAGLFVIGERRFNVGDWILVDGVVEGTVEDIGFRTTTVRRFDRAPVFVPNARLADSAMTNFSRMTHRRIRWIVGLEYRTTHDQLTEIRDRIERYLHDDEAFARPPEVATFVRIDAFSDSSIDLLIYCFTRTTDWGQWLQIKEHLALAIKRIVEDAGAGFAFPSRSLYVETLPEVPASSSRTPEGATAAPAPEPTHG